MNFWFLLVVLGIAWAMQSVFSFLQVKDFSTNYARLRRQGKVAIGKRKSALSAGAITMLLVDDDGFIREAMGMSGLTILARFKPIPGFEGLHISEVEGGPMKRHSKALRIAVLTARDNWVTVQLGQIPQDPPGPLTRLIGRFRRNKKHAEQVVPRAPRQIHVVRTPRTEGVIQS